MDMIVIDHRLEKEMATYSSILVWEIPMTEEEIGGLQPRQLQRFRHNWAAEWARGSVRLKHRLCYWPVTAAWTGGHPLLCLSPRNPISESMCFSTSLCLLPNINSPFIYSFIVQNMGWLPMNAGHHGDCWNKAKLLEGHRGESSEFSLGKWAHILVSLTRMWCLAC